jgi:hypothetical protein
MVCSSQTFPILIAHQWSAAARFCCWPCGGWAPRLRCSQIHKAWAWIHSKFTTHTTRMTYQLLSAIARHLGLSWDFFDNRHEATRSVLKRTELHSFIASPMQAERCSAVGCNSANAAVGNITRAKPRAPIIPLRILLMTFLLGCVGAPRAIDDAGVMPRQWEKRCDCNHKNSLLAEMDRPQRWRSRIASGLPAGCMGKSDRSRTRGDAEQGLQFACSGRITETPGSMGWSGSPHFPGAPS